MTWELIVTAGLSGIVATLVTHWLNDRSRQRSEKERLLRQLTGTWLLEAHPDYQAAIALVPIVFSGDQEVGRARQVYLAHVSKELPEMDAERRIHFQKSREYQAKLIEEMAKVVDLPITSVDLLRTQYVAKGYADRDQLAVSSAYGLVRIADAMEQNNRLLVEMFALQGRGPNGQG